MPPSQEILPNAYQPSAYSDDQTILRRLRFSPDPAVYGDGPYPVVVTVHAGGFRDQDAYGSMSQRWADRDLAKAGFLVFSIDYRLAPDGLIRRQHEHDTTTEEGIASGRPPQQSNDVKQQTLAAYHDPHCNGTVFLVGGLFRRHPFALGGARSGGDCSGLARAASSSSNGGGHPFGPL